MARTGSERREAMQAHAFTVEGLAGSVCELLVTEVVSELPGVHSVEIAGSTCYVHCDARRAGIADIVGALADIGYPAHALAAAA